MHSVPFATLPSTAMDESTKPFSTTAITLALTDDTYTELAHYVERELASRSGNIVAAYPAKENANPFSSDLDGLEPDEMERPSRLRYLPLTTLPCANTYPAKHVVCKNLGKMACSACKLVSYCSKVCDKPFAHLLVVNGSFEF
jgi:hypothetical protein